MLLCLRSSYSVSTRSVFSVKLQYTAVIPRLLVFMAALFHEMEIIIIIIKLFNAHFSNIKLGMFGNFGIFT